MPRSTFANLMGSYDRQSLAILASAENPDGTPYNLPVGVILDSVAAATTTRVTAAITSTLILAANANRRGVVLHNDSTSILYLKFGTAASTTSYTYKVAADGTWEMARNALYTGIIHGIWVAAAGAAQVTEL